LLFPRLIVFLCIQLSVDNVKQVFLDLLRNCIVINAPYGYTSYASARGPIFLHLLNHKIS